MVKAEPPLTRERCRALLSDKSVLPTGLSLRFAVLVLVIAATSATVYGHLVLLLTPDAEAAARSCFGAVRSVPTAGDAGLVPGAMRDLWCSRPFAGTVALASVLGVALVGVVTVLVYFAQPWFLARTWSWTGWRRIDEVTHPPYLRRLDDVVRQLDLPASPRFLQFPRGQPGRARVIGTHRSVSVRVDADLLTTSGQADSGFTGVLLHELAHVRNRDSGPTYLTIAAWNTFVVLVVVPYVALLVLPGLFGAASTAAAPSAHQLVSVFALFALVYLTRASVLRARETLADATADRYDPRGVLETTIRASTGAVRRRPVPIHPTAARRLAALRDPAHLVATDAFALFGVGVGVSLIAMATTITYTWALVAADAVSLPFILSLLGTARDNGVLGLIMIVAAFGPATVIALGVLAGFAGVVGWRDAVLARYTGRRVSPWRRAVPVVVGFMVGEPLSAAYANAGTLGVFDTTAWLRLLDVGLTVVGLTVLLVALLQWVGESATAWLPAAGAPLRSLCWKTTALGFVAWFPFVLVWFTAHNKMIIRYFSPVYAGTEPLSSWPAVEVILSHHHPLVVVLTWPTTAVLVLVAVLWPVRGARRLRAPTALRAAVVRGPVGAAIVVVLLAGVAWVANNHSGVDVFSAVATVPGASLYLLNVLLIVVAVGSVATGVWSSWRAGDLALSAGVLGALICSSLVAVVAPVLYSIALCGTSAFTCMGNDWSRVSSVFMGAAVLGTALSLVLSVPVLLLTTVRRRRADQGVWPRSGTVVIALTDTVLVGGIVAYTHHFARWW
ncbi:M48 family metalloprotease [Actinokineospora diospyrosa]|uniref:Peptidase family M48 n=1 Tax=Actinokineospora diospyrosa TaxID=103728 RepID=A0ABT1IEM4_9PSEU|nr:M48 family metalloprotease [Actinokineospora diospyrosa]MCP2271055.1 Peptidase family M48 [Actinokineospora diospyrosa]